MNFMIIDDDKSVRMILSLLIQKHKLGTVTAQLGSGNNAVEDILFYHPDILLVDLLLPGKEGIEIVHEAVNKGFQGKIVMISCVEDEEMISRAYEFGVMFYISKPINAIETASVLGHVKKMIELERSITMIKSVIFQCEMRQGMDDKKRIDIDEKIDTVFTEIGIIGLSGTEEIKEVLKEVYQTQKSNRMQKYRLKDIYKDVCKRLYGEDHLSMNQKNMEQRIRRTIQKALSNVAEIGCEDYYDPIFSKYSNCLFDFKQVRQEMQHIKDTKAYAGKINTKKFVEGILSKI
ncbi:MAG: response regulator [Lachnospiraceae bacterium]|nr:response regulator [Lachnospiraceae bacterium]